ncbi:hypothetical protein BUALT_Bualt02G0087700 [Buddleja alternifolia]|uniref:Myb/SANT-like domain-containing protein n=1 Tax=Buddleja alternifolia TaxID=168488 RepID=A0AAV6Y0S4_9LAMI|nr:hypothetical protein BUALT_Bualt02G0087700 [Buddleja alternifolia]
MSKGSKVGTFFSRDGWNKICFDFVQKTCLNDDKKQLKNHWDSTKQDWKVWYKLMTFDTELGWDNLTNTANPDAANFRYKGLENSEELTSLFKEGYATGKNTWAPSEGSLPNDSSGPCETQPSQNMEQDMMDFDEENEHEEFKDLVAVALVSVMVGKVVYYYENHMVKKPCRDSIYRGHRFIMDVLNGHSIRCPELFRMEKHVFLPLAKELRQRNLLEDSREVNTMLLMLGIQICLDFWHLTKGAWKSRWPILKKTASFPFQTQRLIVVVSMALHNYIRQEAIADEIFRRHDEDEGYFSGSEETETDLDEDENDNGSYEAMNRQQSEEMALIHDAIADSICQGS